MPERVEDCDGDKESADTHPESVCECDDGKRKDEVREEGCHKNNERFGCEKVQEEPEDPGEEGGCGGGEVGEPVGDDREEDCYYDCAFLSDGTEEMGGVGVQRNGRPIIKFARINGVAP